MQSIADLDLRRRAINDEDSVYSGERAATNHRLSLPNQ